MDSLDTAKRNSQSWLSWFYKGLLLFVFFVLLARTAELQIVKGEYYRNLSEDNRIRRITIKAPRGKILARSGEELVGNTEVTKEIVFKEEGGYEKKDLTSDNNLTNNDSDTSNIISEW